MSFGERFLKMLNESQNGKWISWFKGLGGMKGLTAHETLTAAIQRVLYRKGKEMSGMEEEERRSIRILKRENLQNEIKTERQR